MIKHSTIPIGILMLVLSAVYIWYFGLNDRSKVNTTTHSKQQHRFVRMYQESTQHYGSGWENKAEVESFEVFFDNSSETEFVCAHQSSHESISCFTINAKPSASTSHLK